jgi:two-component system nitrogen regulation response regulator GlnG/two-component system response regulator HydG
VVEDTQTTLDETAEPSRRRRTSQERLALVCVWSAEGSHVGETLLLPLGTMVDFGRGTELVRQRPGTREKAEPIANPYLSRTQLRARNDGDTVLVEKTGKRALVGPDGKEHDKITLAAGQCIEIRGQMVFICVKRPDEMEPLRSLRGKHHPFGEPDAQGFVGESPEAWAIRDDAAFAGARNVHVLLLGASGTGKEVVAQAIHAQSNRAHKKMVSRNAATLPSGIIDAELFGNIANYPNAGTPERPGLVGEADGSTLFLDEIGELTDELQTRLLRLLDDKGEYQRLGDARRRTSDLRFIGATNRPLESLKHDVAARLRLRLSLPGLDARREDVTMVACHLLRRLAVRDPQMAERFFEGDPRTGRPRIAPAFASALTTHGYSTHVRELEALLWRSLASSKDDTLELTEDVEEDLSSVGAKGDRIDPATLTADDVRAALERAGGSREKAWRDLGLANRHVLKRLIKKLGLEE